MSSSFRGGNHVRKDRKDAMKNYELTLVLPGSATVAKENSTNALVEKLIKTFKGTIKKNEKWGKIELSYPIKKNSTGVFLYYELELDPGSASSFKQKINQETDTIIRYLMVVKQTKN